MEISTINNISQTILTPKELLERFKKGERPEYKVNNSDKTLQEIGLFPLAPSGSDL